MEVELTMSHRSGRVMREPDKYDIYDIFGDIYIMVINEFDDDHVFYSRAMTSSEVNL